MSSGEKQEGLAAERRYVAGLYAKLDAERAEAASRLEQERGGGAGRVRLWERDATTAHWSRRLSQLRAAERDLCFGRVDRADGTASYIGRIGLFDDEIDEPLLTDWRAPAARPFYCATPAAPEGITRRRHFRTHGRSLVDFHDDVLAVSEEDQVAVGADSALISALEAPRGESMRDIVSTIQAEQDEIIRLAEPGVVVIEGGPGTGKTAVALHRVAFLLYHHRERLSRRGVLVVGPNTRFLRYIGAVLPSLGESDVVFATPGELYPGVVATVEDGPRQAEIKGDLAMVDLLRRAVADRQELPGEPIEIALDDVTVEIDTKLAKQARQRARSADLPHNPARRIFREHLGALLVEQAVRRIGEGWLDWGHSAALHDELAADVRVELRSHPEFHEVVEQLWPTLTPQRLLTELFTSHDRLSAAACDGASLSALYRSPGDAWTTSDTPLLDEAAELLGEDDVDEQRQAKREKEQEQQYAKEVLQILDSHDDHDDEPVRVGEVVDAAALAERHEERDHRELAERAAADRNWAYGHLVVDEAQELSSMTWRVLMRRCPSRSATVVGDLAQRHSSGAAGEWSAALSPHVGDRWTYRRLSTNYRTPAEIMTVAAAVLREFVPDVQPPDSVRHGDKPWRRQVDADALADAAWEAVEQETAPDGRSIAVIGDATTLRGITVPEHAVTLTPTDAKGLEFDVVIVLAPEEILRGVHGGADLYVALTRATRRLGVLHVAQLPEFLVGTDARWAAPTTAGPQVRVTR